MKQLERLLFLQGNRCFFCAGEVPVGEASVEHLLATSNGGLKEDANCVVCCKAVNAALGNLSVKEKFQAVLNQRARFVCPRPSGSAVAEESRAVTHEEVAGKIDLVVAYLQKHSQSRPGRVAALKNTMNSVFQKTLTEPELDILVSNLQSLGYIIVEGTKVTYALPIGS